MNIRGLISDKVMRKWEEKDTMDVDDDEILKLIDNENETKSEDEWIQVTCNFTDEDDLTRMIFYSGIQ